MPWFPYTLTDLQTEKLILIDARYRVWSDYALRDTNNAVVYDDTYHERLALSVAVNCIDMPVTFGVE